MRELTEQHVAKLSGEQRRATARAILKGLTGEERERVCAEIPEICSFVMGKTSTCETSCGPGSKELAELTERLQVLGTELRKYGAAMKRKEELKVALAQLDLMELAARAEQEAA